MRSGRCVKFRVVKEGGILSCEGELWEFGWVSLNY